MKINNFTAEYNSLPKAHFTRLTPGGTKKYKPLNSNERLLLSEAERHGVRWFVIPDTQIIEFHMSNRIGYVKSLKPSTNQGHAERICMDKNLTRRFLLSGNLQVSNGFNLLPNDTEDYFEEIFSKLKKPLVVKPANSAMGQGVETNIEKYDHYLSHIRTLVKAANHENSLSEGNILVEETAVGKEYRIIATRDKVLAVIHRRPASVMGDGSSSIKELIAGKNLDPMRELSSELYPKIQIDSNMTDVLQRQNLTIESVPPADLHVKLRDVSNIMAGGDSFDFTDVIHPDVVDIATSAIQSIPGLSYGGIDFMSTDITSSQDRTTYTIIEINSAPAFAMHHFPMIGESRNVAKPILQLMFPEIN